MSKKKISSLGDNWDDFKQTILTPEERNEIDVRVALISELISAREELGMSQKQLEAESGVKQPVISRIERGSSDPQLSTMLKVLRPLGKTIAIVPLEEDNPLPA
ncbi:MAG: helix-turn-helix domain-containing protein [Flexilinea sp.]